MIDIALLSIYSYALYRMAQGYNIMPWKWIIRYVVAFTASVCIFMAVMMGIYGESMIKDQAFIQKLGLTIEPFMLLYEFGLFYFFRTRIVRYVHDLDQIDEGDNNNFPNPPAPNKDNTKEKQDFSYFR